LRYAVTPPPPPLVWFWWLVCFFCGWLFWVVFFWWFFFFLFVASEVNHRQIAEERLLPRLCPHRLHYSFLCTRFEQMSFPRLRNAFFCSLSDPCHFGPFKSPSVVRSCTFFSNPNEVVFGSPTPFLLFLLARFGGFSDELAPTLFFFLACGFSCFRWCDRRRSTRIASLVSNFLGLYFLFFVGVSPLLFSCFFTASGALVSPLVSFFFVWFGQLLEGSSFPNSPFVSQV